MSNILTYHQCICKPLVLSELIGCREKRSVSIENEVSEEIKDNGTEFQISDGELVKIKISDKSAMDSEIEYMKLYFNETEIPVIWEDCTRTYGGS